jgi:hypothetical protein
MKMRICHFFPNLDVVYYRQDTMMRCLHHPLPLEEGVKSDHPRLRLHPKSPLAELPNDNFESLASIPILLPLVLLGEVHAREQRPLLLNGKARPSLLSLRKVKMKSIVIWGQLDHRRVLLEVKAVERQEVGLWVTMKRLPSLLQGEKRRRARSGREGEGWWWMMTMMGNWYVSSVVFDYADTSGLQGSCEEEEAVN